MLFCISIFCFVTVSKKRLLFRITGTSQIPFLLSYAAKANSFFYDVKFGAGGAFGEAIFSFQRLFRPNDFIFIWAAVSLALVFQVDGSILLLRFMYLILSKLQLIAALKYVKNIFISWICRYVPFMRRFFENNDLYLFTRAIDDSVHVDIENMYEEYSFEEEIYGQDASGTALIRTSSYVLPYELIPASSSSEKSEFDCLSGDRSNELIEIAKSFGIDMAFVASYKGPLIITSLFELSSSNRLSKLFSLEIEFARLLGSPDLKIIYPIMKYPSCIGFEYKSENREITLFMDHAYDDKFIHGKEKISLLCGVNTYGEVRIYDLTTMPHLLLAGSSGSGKSMTMHAFIVSILWKYSPRYCKLVLIDPKHVEYNAYEGISHLSIPIAKSINEILNALNWCVEEMNRRYSIFSKFKVKNISEYSEKIFDGEKMSYIVIFIDEYADIVMQNKSAEHLVIRLVQMARASGIHVIMATQRPSVDIVTGALKANMPFRISFRVASSVDSKVILGCDGAQKLLGYGDMIVLNEIGVMERICGPYLSVVDIEKIVSCIRSQNDIMSVTL
jgi:hypothetical protein